MFEKMNWNELRAKVLGWTQQIAAYTPVWTGATANPAIGDGTIAGRYVLRGKLCRVSINVTMGAGTTYGTGAWSFSLPFPAASGVGVNWFGFAALFDTSTGQRSDRNVAVMQGATAVGQFVPQADGSTATTITATVPFTWAAGDILAITAEYEVK